MGLNPGWREAIGHFILSVGFPDAATKQEFEAVVKRGRRAMDKLSRIAPGLGAYLNEANWVRQVPFRYLSLSLVLIKKVFRRSRSGKRFSGATTTLDCSKSRDASTQRTGSLVIAASAQI
jgi:hypothetical protein